MVLVRYSMYGKRCSEILLIYLKREGESFKNLVLVHLPKTLVEIQKPGFFYLLGDVCVSPLTESIGCCGAEHLRVWWKPPILQMRICSLNFSPVQRHSCTGQDVDAMTRVELPYHLPWTLERGKASLWTGKHAHNTWASQDKNKTLCKTAIVTKKVF